MEHWERERFVARICSGSIRCPIVIDDNRLTVVLKNPSKQQLYIASEVYADALRNAELNDLFSDSELYDWLISIEAWDDDKDELVTKLPKEIEEFKLALYKSTFRSNERQAIRKALGIAKDKLASLNEERNAYNYLSCSGYAAICKQRYLIGCSMFWENDSPVFPGNTFWDGDSRMLDAVMSFYAKSRISETAYRDLARNDPWRSIWSAKKAESSLFGCCVVDYTDEQKQLVAWSGLYENIYGHPECPPEAVIEDDDMLDGWMIERRRERDQKVNQSAGEGAVGNEKIKNSDEVYLVAETTDDARKIMRDLNDEHGQSILRSRFKYLREKGEVNEVDMPDTKKRLRMEVTNKFMNEMRGNQ